MPVGGAQLRDRRRRSRAARAAADGDRDRQRALRGHRRYRADGREIRTGRLDRALHAVPLRRVEEQAVLRRLALGRGIPRFGLEPALLPETSMDKIKGAMLLAAGRVCLLCAAAAWALPQETSAQAYPSRMVVPFPPGGPSDTLGRILAQKFTERWGQTVIVDNRPGGNTLI